MFSENTYCFSPLFPSVITLSIYILLSLSLSLSKSLFYITLDTKSLTRCRGQRGLLNDKRRQE